MIFKKTLHKKRYTGYKDVDGKKIFEQDLLGFFDFYSMEYWEGRVIYIQNICMVSVGDAVEDTGDEMPLKQIAAEYRMLKLPG